MNLIKITKDGDELTRYGFVSRVEHYLRQLLTDPKSASIDDVLKSHGITNSELLPLLLKRSNPSDVESAIVCRTEKIKTNPETKKDSFCIKYSIPKKDFNKKLRNLYINLFENYQTNNILLNEDGEGGCACGDGGTMAGATSCDASSGQFIQPLSLGKKKGKKDDKDDSETIIRRDFHGVLESKKPHKKTIYITEEQLMSLREDCPAEVGTAFGNFGYDAPGLEKKKNDPAYDHKDMMKNSWNN